MNLMTIEVRVVRMPLVRPFTTSQGVTHERDALIAHVIGDVEGWGEADTPQLAIEMATLDAELKARRVSLAEHLGGTRATIESTATVGFDDDVDEFLAAGYRSIKLKVSPDRVPELPAGCTVQVDANGSFASCPERVAALDDLGLLAIEQPLAVDDIAGHRELTRRLHTAVCLDESIRSADAVDPSACRAACVKLFRLGSLAAFTAVHDRCVELDLDAKVGGMLETGIGRAAALALASLPGFTLPADLSASDRYWQHDLTAPFVLDRDGRLPVPSGPGLGVDVDIEAVERFTVSIDTARR